MSATTQFDGTEPNRSDLRMILRAAKQGWPVDPSKRASIAAFCMRSKLTGRFDRLTNLAAEVLAALEQAELAERSAADAEKLEETLADLRAKDEAILSENGFTDDH